MSTNEGAGQTTVPEPDPIEFWRRNGVWILFCLGLVLILFQGVIAGLLATKSAGEATFIDAALAHDIASNVRLLGVLSFVAGLVERLAKAISARPEAR
jgi:hypothetical protein